MGEWDDHFLDDSSCCILIAIVIASIPLLVEVDYGFSDDDDDKHNLSPNPQEVYEQEISSFPEFCR